MLAREQTQTEASEILGTLNINNSCIDQILSVNPADIAGVRFSHILGEPLPLVGIGSDSRRRKLRCVSTK